jgi:hypothetical protein
LAETAVLPNPPNADLSLHSQATNDINPIDKIVVSGIDLKDKIPSIEDTINLYHSSKNFLLSKGYKQLTSYDFMKDDGNGLD